jgi:hypothetical protein
VGDHLAWNLVATGETLPWTASSDRGPEEIRVNP